MNDSIALLSVTAISIGFFHTLLGPDHYLPFIVLSQARNWSLKKTMIITFLCGLGHVLSSVILGLVRYSGRDICYQTCFSGIISRKHCCLAVYCFRSGLYDYQYKKSDKEKETQPLPLSFWWCKTLSSPQSP